MKHNKQQGSALISSMIVIIIVAIIIGSQIKLIVQERQNLERSILYDMALDIAESGAEDAVRDINRDDFSEWKTKDNDSLYFEVTGLDYGDNRSGAYQILLSNQGSKNPNLVIEGIASHPTVGSVKRQLAITLSTRGIFGNGIIAKDSINLEDHPIEIDGYDSDRGDYDSFLNQVDTAHVAAESDQVAAISIANAEILGHVASSGQPPEKGPNAKIRGKQTEDGTDIDSDRIYDDYYADFPQPTAPSLTLPSTNLPSPDENGNIQIGGGFDESYQLNKLDIDEDETLVIVGPTVIVVTGKGDIDGDILFENDGSLKLYIDGDLEIQGDVYMDNVVAEDFQIFNTNTNEGDTEIYLNHLGSLKVAVLAPNSLVTFEKGARKEDDDDGDDDDDDDDDDKDDDDDDDKDDDDDDDKDDDDDDDKDDDDDDDKDDDDDDDKDDDDDDDKDDDDDDDKDDDDDDDKDDDDDDDKDDDDDDDNDNGGGSNQNNGFGNGDQDAPGNSEFNNNAENAGGNHDGTNDR